MLVSGKDGVGLSGNMDMKSKTKLKPHRVLLNTTTFKCVETSEVSPHLEKPRLEKVDFNRYWNGMGTCGFKAVFEFQVTPFQWTPLAEANER